MEVEDDSGNMVKIQVNESTTLLKAIKGNGRVDDLQGVRINNIKYRLTRYDETNKTFYYKGVTYLKKEQCGCCIALTNKCAIIGTFSQDEG